MNVSINDLLGYALDSGASDLHLSVGSIPMVRIDGIMQKLKLPIMNLTSKIYNKAIKKYGPNSNHLKVIKLLEQNNKLTFSAILLFTNSLIGKLNNSSPLHPLALNI